MEPVNVLQKAYKTARKYEKRRNCETFGQIKEIYAQLKQNGPCLMRHGTTIMIDVLSQTEIDCEETVSHTSPAGKSLERFGQKRRQRFLALVS